MPFYAALTPERACAELAAVGIRVKPDELELVRRDEKWRVTLPGERLAWFAATEAGQSSMAHERKVLRVLEACCRFVAPRVLQEAPDARFDVRAMVPGAHDGHGVFLRVRDDADAASRVGATLGAMLAELHSKVRAAEVAGWLPRTPSWPEPRAWVRDRLPSVVDDARLHAEADAVMARYEEVLDEVQEADRALVHTDLGLHNISIDTETLQVHGVFDWEAACWADRHLDFRYFEFDFDRFELLDAALAVYESAIGCRLSRERIHLYNAACAISYLAFRVGVPPDEQWCGRTLSQDLQWTRRAIVRVS